MNNASNGDIQLNDEEPSNSEAVQWECEEI